MESLTSKLRENWFIIVFTTSMIVWYANTTTRLDALELKVNDQEIVEKQITQMQIDLAVIKANVEFIKKEIQ